jgi:hypothetical protein
MIREAMYPEPGCRPFSSLQQSLYLARLVHKRCRRVESHRQRRHNHYALHADVMLEGPQKVSVRMNGAGRAILTLVPGEYRIEASEPSHNTLRTHCRIAQGANLRFTILLEPENLPREEHPEILNANERPGFTLLHGYTVDADTGKPIAGVKVRVGHANVETWSDSVGHYLLSVPTPKSKFPEVWVPTRWSSRKEDIRQKNSPTSEGPELKWAEKRTS